MKAKKPLMRAVAFLLVLAVAGAVFFLSRPVAEEDPSPCEVVRIWNVDTFEGGKGSRTSFLRAAARRAEAQTEGVKFLVSSYTAEGAEDALARGQKPDLLSFGIGFSAGAEYSLPLGGGFSGGEVNGKVLALPWCRGAYALFSRAGATGTRTVISRGGENLVEVAAALGGVEGRTEDSMRAYVAFLNGKYDRLLGTQRDLCRFAARGADVSAEPLTQFCDLYQYISMLSGEHAAACRVFLSVLLGEETQAKLASIGMYPVISGTDDVSAPQCGLTASVFSSREALDEMRLLCGSADGRKKLMKFLKKI